jgi:hypothetical protein
LTKQTTIQIALVIISLFLFILSFQGNAGAISKTINAGVKKLSVPTKSYL